MILFNELRITPDGKYLVIDVSVLKLDYYSDITINSIHIDTLKSFIETGPSSKPLYRINYNGVNHIREFIDISSISNNLFFIWVVTDGDPREDTPCGMKERISLGVTYNKTPLYDISMKYLNNLESCSPNKEFIDFILKRKALDICLCNGNYNLAIKYWNKFFLEDKLLHVSNCGCNGILK